jgi:parallel beta-helix repeat protein
MQKCKNAKMQNALAKSPWEVLLDIRPVSLAAKSDNPDMVPILFSHNGVYYIGWQMRGTLVPAFDCQYDELWVPSSDSKRQLQEKTFDKGLFGRISDEQTPVIVVATRGLSGDYQTISAAIKKAKAGSRILVKPGIYQESLVIDKPLQIIGDGKVAEIVVESWDADCIFMKTEHALVRGLSLRCRAEGKYYAVDIPQGQLTLEHCDMTSDSLACVGIHGNKTEGIVSHCQIHDGKSAGVFVYDNGSGRIESCEIFGNALTGIEIREGGNPIVQHCQIHDGKSAGVIVYNNGTGRIESCEIFGNALAGIAIKTGGNPIVQNCTIKRNAYQAVWVYDGGAGTIENCDLRDNAKGAWDIESGCDVRRRGNLT